MTGCVSWYEELCDWSELARQLPIGHYQRVGGPTDDRPQRPHRADAFTIATMPALIAAGRVDHASKSASRSRSGAEVLSILLPLTCG